MYKDLQTFITSTPGQIVTVGIIILIFISILLSGKTPEKKFDIKAMTISALLIAVAMVLSNIKVFSMPQGGSITLLSMLPIALCAYLLGAKRGLMAGIALGMLNLLLGPYVIHPLQLLVDYPLAFGALGIGGILRNKKNGLAFGYLLGVLGRYVCAVISGVVFFGSYAPEGFSALTWSLWYNFTYLFAEGAITFVILRLPPVRNAFASLKAQI